MTAKVLVFCFATLIAACDESRGPRLPLPTQPSAPNPPPPPAPPVVVVERISVGQEVTGTYTGAELIYEFIAAADGRLVAQLSWDVGRNGSLLSIKLGDSEYRLTDHPWSPVVGNWFVVSGQSYRLIVDRWAADHAGAEPFVLRTQLE
jgi:hypothetical protein